MRLLPSPGDPSTSIITSSRYLANQAVSRAASPSVPIPPCLLRVISTRLPKSPLATSIVYMCVRLSRLLQKPARNRKVYLPGELLFPRADDAKRKSERERAEASLSSTTTGTIVLYEAQLESERERERENRGVSSARAGSSDFPDVIT